MSSYLGYYGGRTAAAAPTNERITFIRRTYAHLAGAIGLFVLLEVLFFKLGFDRAFMSMLQRNPWSLLVVMVAFIGAGYLGQYMAHARDRTTQYLGLGLYTLLEAIIFLPILTFAQLKAQSMGDASGMSIIGTAGILTTIVFGGLTAVVFLTKKDFSFLGYGLAIAGFLMLGLIICAMIFGLQLGIWFSALGIALAAAYVLYDTSNVLHHYHTEQYVGASLQLFASVALMFYYILRLLIQTAGSNE
jgi:FtsH-binding integral membrane protein